jgi:hypothetical protein
LRWPVATALAIAAALIVEVVLPGQTLYHSGWYNVGVAALGIVTVAAGRRRFAQARVARARAALAALMAGTAILVVAGMANGLLAPDNQTIVGAPGQQVRVESLGTIVFPVATAEAGAPRVHLERPFHSPVEIGTSSHAAGNFMLRTRMRSVVYVEARDLHGSRLTVTQPEGVAFLSPVLLMQHQQTIAGMDLPFDSFTVPAAHRVVKAVMFTPGEAAMLLHGEASPGETAVLFAVDDQNDRPLPHAIALSPGGRPVRAGGLALSGLVRAYPAVEVVAIPNIAVMTLGVLLIVAAAIALAYQKLAGSY